MFQHLFCSPALVRPHEDGPALRDRKTYLESLAKQGYGRRYLRRVANELLLIAAELDFEHSGVISVGKIQCAARRLKQQPPRGRRAPLSAAAAARFSAVAKRWCRFLGRLPPRPHTRFSVELAAYITYLTDERGCTPTTVETRTSNLTRFLDYYGKTGRSLSDLQIQDLDGFLLRLANRGCCRRSVIAVTKELRPFVRFGAQRAWWPARLFDAMLTPRLYRDEELPIGPTWDDVTRLLASAVGDSPSDIRDSAILRLLITYGLRACEVCALRLDDVDWTRGQLMISRAKRRDGQVYPLVSSVAASIARYLKVVRPASTDRHIFLALLRPWRPIRPANIYTAVSRRLRTLGITYPRHLGPHSLRHSAAQRLLSEGLSMKEIGDHLGHRSSASTRIYTKVDLSALRSVAAVTLEGVQ
jgi:site-specific recombinase XerD